jgi:prostaglandin-endoperoxide synthase 2
MDMIENLREIIVRPVNWLAERWPWSARKSNAIAINSTVNVSQRPPHPWSTVHDYVSWQALTNLRWSARHLPPRSSSLFSAAV